MKKVLVDGYFVGNVGDDLFLKILTENFNNFSFTVFIDKKYARFYKKNKNLKVINKSLCFKILNKILCYWKSPLLGKKIMRNYDVYLEIGGSIFQQNKYGQVVLNKRENILATRKPYYIIGSNFGPYLENNFKDAYSIFFKKISGITFRDTYSYSLFSDIPTTSFAPDVVFNLNSQSVPMLRTEYQYVTVVPIDLINRSFSEDIRKKYEDKLAGICKYYIDNKYAVKILAFNNYEGDLDVSKRICKKIGNENSAVEVVKYTSIETVLSIIKGSYRLISSRFHAMILGWIFQVPQLVIKYNEKMDNVIEDLFSEQLNFTVDSFVNSNISNFFAYMNTIDLYTLKKVQRKANRQFYQLDVFLNNRN